MEGILTELSENDISRINEKVFYKVPALAIPLSANALSIQRKK
jgi:hypothetical protein